jgi:hypothetical protein
MFNTMRFILNHPFNRNHRWSALGRYFKWQVGSRILRYSIVVPRD